MAKLNILEINYPMDCRDAFENIATHIFCVMLKLSGGVNRPVEKKGMESYPVQIGPRLYAYQAKYYDPATKLKDRKEEFVTSVREARRKGITDLVFFVNKDHTEDSRIGEKASYLKEIESVAEGAENESVVKLDWWTLSRIEQTLDMPEYQYIRDIYLGKSETDSHDLSSFYDYIYNECIDDSESELYGGMSLLDSYIEPTLEINDTSIRSYSRVRSYLEKWVEGAAPITVICGEPGHGKTSLCYKAMCDYYIDGWLAGKVSNVFCFSLNPANTNALSNGSLNIYELLSWGDDRQNQKIKKEECRGALIFFDGFDELKEWHTGIDMETLIRNHIIPFQKSTNTHIVITSRTMAVDPEKSSFAMRNGIIPINKLQPITREEQYKWIENYIHHVRESSPEKADEIVGYFKNYQKLFDHPLTDSDSLKELLGIPIIFRMIVTACYLPQKGQDFTTIYDELFDITWERHRRQDDKDPLTVKAQLAKHALQIFIDNNETAETGLLGNTPWIFSFYTRHEGRRRVGFLHRSFYQYFLAYEVLSWYKKYAYDNDKDELIKRFSYLSKRRLDRTTLIFIKELYEQVGTKEAIGTAFNESYNMLKMTDGILPLPTINGASEKIALAPPLVRANNVFWNIISIGSVCCTSLSSESVNKTCLSIFDLTGCILRDAQFRKSLLIRAHLSNADLHDADLSDADLRHADLSAADLIWADLRGAHLRGAHLSRADLTWAVLHHADLSEAELHHASLCKADLREANLSEADLSDADLRGARLHGAYLNRADFSEADLREADIFHADLRHADLRGADLSDADLCGAHLRGADLRGAHLRGAHLSRADFSEADLRHADLSATDFSEADLSAADLREADLSAVRLHGAHLNDANLLGARLIVADLSGTDVSGVKVTEKAYEYICQQKVINIDKICIIAEDK